MENTIRTDVMDAISNIDDVVTESDLSVISSMIESFDKASVILENYNGDDVEMFNIFQEAAEEKKNPLKEDTWWKTILYFIPNLVGLIISKIKKLFGKEEQTKTQQVINAVKNAPQEAKDFVSNIMESAAKFIADKTGMEEGTAEKVVVIAGISVPIGVAGALINKATEAMGHGANFVEKFITATGKAPSNPGDAKYAFHKYTKGKKKDTWTSSIDLEILLKNVEEYSDIVSRYEEVYKLIGSGKEDGDLASKMSHTNGLFEKVTKTNYFVAKSKEYTDEDVEKFLGKLDNIMNGLADKCTEIQQTLNSFKHNKFDRKDESGKYVVPEETQKLLKNQSALASTNMNNITKYIISVSKLKEDLVNALREANAVVNEGGSILQKIKAGVHDKIHEHKARKENLDYGKSKGDDKDKSATTDYPTNDNDDDDAPDVDVADELKASDEDIAKYAKDDSAGSKKEEVTEEYDTSWYNR